jgi:hypothetical protein
LSVGEWWKKRKTGDGVRQDIRRLKLGYENKNATEVDKIALWKNGPLNLFPNTIHFTLIDWVQRGGYTIPGLFPQ